MTAGPVSSEQPIPCPWAFRETEVPNESEAIVTYYCRTCDEAFTTRRAGREHVYGAHEDIAADAGNAYQDAYADSESLSSRAAIARAQDAADAVLDAHLI